MAAELFPTKKLVSSASASSTSIQQYQQQNVTNNNTTTAQGCCNWQGLYPTIRERSVWSPPGGWGGGVMLSDTAPTLVLFTVRKYKSVESSVHQKSPHDFH